ncbi:MAG: nicotinate (nicotinamide) nucleotide adenylyltransferase [Polyangiales bacterium]
MARTVAIYGGSFDPPHVAHVLVASYVLSTAEVDELWVIPTWEHPFAKHLNAPFEARVEMCNLAFGLFERARVLRTEGELGGVSRTLHTLEELRRRDPDVAFRLVMGADLLSETDRWHAFDKVRTIAPPLVVGRAGHEHAEGSPFDFPAISSTDVRDRVQKGASVRGLIPHAVATYIERHQLYRAR